MGTITNYICLTAFLVGFVNSAVLQVDKCKLEDSSCMLSAFQAAVPAFMAGIPDIGVEVMDVMELDNIAFDLSGLKFTLDEGRLKGFKGSVVDKVKWDLKKKRLLVEFHCNMTVKGHYTAAGRLLILPISGDGQMRLKIRNVVIPFGIDYKMTTGEDGKKYVVPTKYDFDFEVKDNAHFNMTGLFNGNTELSDTMLNFLNQNWKQVAVEFGRPLIDAAAKKLFKGLVAFLKSESIEDIAIL